MQIIPCLSLFLTLCLAAAAALQGQCEAGTLEAEQAAFQECFGQKILLWSALTVVRDVTTAFHEVQNHAFPLREETLENLR